MVNAMNAKIQQQSPAGVGGLTPLAPPSSKEATQASAPLASLPLPDGGTQDITSPQDVLSYVSAWANTSSGKSTLLTLSDGTGQTITADPSTVEGQLAIENYFVGQFAVNATSALSAGTALLESATTPSADGVAKVGSEMNGAQMEGFAAVLGSDAMKQAEGMVVLLADIMAKLKKSQQNNNAESIEAQTNQLIAQNAEKIKKLEEAAHKMEQAAKAAAKAGLLGKIAIAFEAVGALLAVATAAILIASGVGAPLGAVLILGATTALMGLVDSGMKAGGKENGIAGSQKGAEIFGYTMMAVGIATAVVSVGMLAKGVGTAAATGADAAAKGAEAGAEAAEKAATSSLRESLKSAGNAVKNLFKDVDMVKAQKINLYAAKAQSAVDIGQAGLSAGSAGMDYDAAKYTASSQKSSAAAKEMEADAAQTTKFTEQLVELLKRMLDSNDHAIQQLAHTQKDMVDTIIKSAKQIGRG